MLKVVLQKVFDKKRNSDAEITDPCGTTLISPSSTICRALLSITRTACCL